MRSEWGISVREEGRVASKTWGDLRGRGALHERWEGCQPGNLLHSMGRTRPWMGRHGGGAHMSPKQ